MDEQQFYLKSGDRWRSLMRCTLFTFLSAISVAPLVLGNITVWILFLSGIFSLGTILEISRFLTWKRPRVILRESQLIIVNYWGFGIHTIPTDQILTVETRRKTRGSDILFIRIISDNLLRRGSRRIAIWISDFEENSGNRLKEQLLTLAAQNSREHRESDIVSEEHRSK